MNKRVTITDVLNKKKRRPFGGFESFFEFEKYSVLIMGGDDGLYGDFIETFEVSIINNKTNNFETKLFCGGKSVMKYVSCGEVENVLNIFTGVPSPEKQGGGVS